MDIETLISIRSIKTSLRFEDIYISIYVFWDIYAGWRVKIGPFLNVAQQVHWEEHHISTEHLPRVADEAFPWQRYIVCKQYTLWLFWIVIISHL